MSVLPIVTPPFVIALALVVLFGRTGLVTGWLSEAFGIPRSRWLYGLPGVAIAQLLTFSPIAFLILPGALSSILVGVRYALGFMWVILIVAETISAQSGIGYMTMNAREFLQTDVVVLAIHQCSRTARVGLRAGPSRRWRAWGV